MGLLSRSAFAAVLMSVMSAPFGSPAQAEKRVALVVGNSAYTNIPRLANPANDAKLVADTLRALGFSLVGGAAQLDLDKPKFDAAVQAFGAQLAGADVGLFYYAGHGVQVRGANYLVPVGANPTKEADVDFQMLDTNLVLRQMEGAGAKLNLVVLDACRNNPFGGRGLRAADAGLAQMRAPEGTLISFATQPGNVAQDGADGNSPYTKALAQAISKPGLDIFRTFNEVGLAVSGATGGAQQPWVSLSPIKGDFYFAGAPAARVEAVAPADPAERAWGVTQNTSSVAVLETFIHQYGETFYGTMARARLEELRKAEAARAKPAAPPPPSPANAGAPSAIPSDAPPARVAAVAPPARPAGPPMPIKPAVGIFPPEIGVPPAPGAAPLTPERERGLQPKDVFKECDQCPEMVVIPAGSFTMGSPATEKERFNNEGPQRVVTMSAPYAMGRMGVSFAEWDACAEDGGCNGYRPSDEGWGRGRRPVIRVSWHDAKAYVGWLSKKTGRDYRLLGEAEREYAARSGTKTPFWWGQSIAPDQANYNGTYAYDGGARGENRRKTIPVDSFQPNSWGLYQVHGNLWEWMEDCWTEQIDTYPSNGSAQTAGKCSDRVLRGGSWINSPRYLRAAARISYPANTRDKDLGFRVARSLRAR